MSIFLYKSFIDQKRNILQGPVQCSHIYLSLSIYMYLCVYIFMYIYIYMMSNIKWPRAWRRNFESTEDKLLSSVMTKIRTRTSKEPNLPSESDWAIHYQAKYFLYACARMCVVVGLGWVCWLHVFENAEGTMEAILFRLQRASYQMRKISGCARARNVGNVFLATDSKGNR